MEQDLRVLLVALLLSKAPPLPEIRQAIIEETDLLEVFDRSCAEDQAIYAAHEAMAGWADAGPV